MDYYDKLIEKIESLIDTDKEKALSIIEEELNMPYVPRDILKKLLNLKNSIYIEHDISKSLDQILAYLYDDEDKQMIASYKLDEVNLRQCLDQIDKYLKSDGILEAKLNIIISLIKQEISKDLAINRDGFEYNFNPINLKLIEDNDIYKAVKKKLNDYYMKNPDKLSLASDILYKELYYYLPFDTSKINIDDLFIKIVNIIEDSFK